MRARRALPLLTALALVAALTACTEPEPDPRPPLDIPTPSAPVDGALAFDDIVGIVTNADAPPTALSTLGDTLSTSGDVLADEQDYWIAVGGRPASCADVVSGPYLVGSGDSGDRLDDPAAVLATFTEADEALFGLIQVFAREFDGESDAAAFLTELQAAIAACPGYQFVDDGTVTWNAVSLATAPLDTPPDGIDGFRYTETLRASRASSVTTTFVQRERIVIAVYAELFPTSTLTTADATTLADTIAERLSML